MSALQGEVKEKLAKFIRDQSFEANQHDELMTHSSEIASDIESTLGYLQKLTGYLKSAKTTPRDSNTIQQSQLATVFGHVTKLLEEFEDQSLGSKIADTNNTEWLVDYKELHASMLQVLFRAQGSGLQSSAAVSNDKLNVDELNVQPNFTQQVIIAKFNALATYFNKEVDDMAEAIGAAADPECLVLLMQLQEEYQKGYNKMRDILSAKDLESVVKPVTLRSLLEKAFAAAGDNGFTGQTVSTASITQPSQSEAASMPIPSVRNPINDRRDAALNAYKLAIEVERKESWVERLIAATEAFVDLSGLRNINEWAHEWLHPIGYSAKMKLLAAEYLQHVDKDGDEKEWKETRFSKLAGVLPEKDKDEIGTYDNTSTDAGKELQEAVDKEFKRVQKAIDQGILGKINKQFSRAPK